MSDFLTNVTQKNLGSPLTVRPRLPGWFEPWPVTTRPSVEGGAASASGSDSLLASPRMAASADDPLETHLPGLDQSVSPDVADSLPNYQRQSVKPAARIAAASPETETTRQSPLAQSAPHPFHSPLQPVVEPGQTPLPPPAHLLPLASSPGPAALPLSVFPSTRLTAPQPDSPSTVSPLETEPGPKPISLKLRPVQTEGGKSPLIEPETIEASSVPGAGLARAITAVSPSSRPSLSSSAIEPTDLERQIVGRTVLPDSALLERLVQDLLVARLASPAATAPAKPEHEHLWPPALAGPGAQAKPAPTIHVSIGRIEVRASTPPAPASKKERPASPVMSLDEYLRQRSRRSGQ